MNPKKENLYFPGFFIRNLHNSVCHALGIYINLKIWKCTNGEIIDKQ